MDFQYSHEQVLLADTVRKIASRYGSQYFQEKSNGRQGSTELWGELTSAGFMSVHLPVEFGGGGTGLAELAIVAEEVAAAGCPLLLMLVSPAICANLIRIYGTSQQRTEWLQQFCSPNFLMAFAITEAAAGSNSHNISLSCELKGDSVVLNGSKQYISGCNEASHVMVVARYSDPAGFSRSSDLDREMDSTSIPPRIAEYALVMVPVNAEGFSSTAIPMEITSPETQFSLWFDEVNVARDCLVGNRLFRLNELFYGLDPERIVASAMATGIGRYALNHASQYANIRKVWDTSIGAHQGIAHPLARSFVGLESARLMWQKAAWAFDTPGHEAEIGELTNLAKYSASEACLQVLDSSIQTLGGNGLSSEYGLASLWGLARLLRIAPVSSEMILNYVAQRSLDLDKSY